MRKWKQRLWSLLLCGAMLTSLCAPVAAEEVIDSGDFEVDGGFWSWVLDSDGRLTITPDPALSSQPMPDFTPSGSPWDEKAGEIKSVVVDPVNGGLVLSIGAFAFLDCTNLTEITLPDSVTTIGISAFESCANLTKITLPDSLIAIEETAFANCTNLREITLPDSVTTIGDAAFANCTNLREITLPDSLTTIGDRAFSYCVSLTEITLPDSVTTIKISAFQGCTSLTDITLPGNLISIGESAFRGCANLTEIALPDSVTTIGYGAFEGCASLREVTLPDSVTIIGYGAFMDCTDLISITFTGDNPPTINATAFANCSGLTEIRVPAGAEVDYKQILSNISLNLGSGGIELKGMYSITVTATEGGTASASPDFAAAGDTITLTAVPEEGYSFVEWVSDDVEITGNSFVMPAGAVTVKAVFEKEAAPQPPSHTHAWASDWSRDDGHHWHECLAEGCTILSDIGKDGYAAHTPGDWIVDQAATSSTAGSRHKECTVCGYTTQTEAIPATGGGGGGGSSGGGSYAPPTYKPDVPQPSEGGSVSVSPSSPKQGDTVTVKPRPDEGYEVEKITVTDRNGKPVEVTKKLDGTYTFTQPGGKVKIEVTYQRMETPWSNPFADVSEGDWYYEAVRFAQERGLMNGYSDGRFGADDTLSRAQLAQILFNKEGRPGADSLPDFSDVAGEAWYAGAVRWAAGQGIVGGYGNGTFGPNDPITREQLAVMLWRYSGSPAAASTELNFNDEAEIGGYAQEALRWAVENGILNGYGDGRLGPQGQATRAQVAQMLKNFIENQEETT